jgi:hypothetical protein
MSSRDPGDADPLTGLLERSFHSGPPVEANQLIDDVRQQVKAAQGRAVNYEIALMGRGWDYLRQKVAPLLALFLKDKRMKAESCAPCFISLFSDDALHFIRAQDFFEHLRQAEGLDRASFAQMVRTWEQTGRRSVAALLPGPDPGPDSDPSPDN